MWCGAESFIFINVAVVDIFDKDEYQQEDDET